MASLLYFLLLQIILQKIPRMIMNPVGNYMFKANNRNIRTKCEICSKLIIKIPEDLILCIFKI